MIIIRGFSVVAGYKAPIANILKSKDLGIYGLPTFTDEQFSVAVLEQFAKIGISVVHFNYRFYVYSGSHWVTDSTCFGWALEDAANHLVI